MEAYQDKFVGKLEEAKRHIKVAMLRYENGQPHNEIDKELVLARRCLRDASKLSRLEQK